MALNEGISKFFTWILVILFFLVIFAICVFLFVIDLLTFFRFKITKRFWESFTAGLWSALH